MVKTNCDVVPNECSGIGQYCAAGDVLLNIFCVSEILLLEIFSVLFWFFFKMFLLWFHFSFLHSWHSCETSHGPSQKHPEYILKQTHISWMQIVFSVTIVSFSFFNK